MFCVFLTCRTLIRVQPFTTLKHFPLGFKKFNESNFYVQRNVKLKNSEIMFKSYFHTSPQRYNPIVSVVVRNLIKVASVLGGRYVRNKWKNLSTKSRQDILHFLLYHKFKIMSFFGLVMAAIYFYYISHIQETPITKRKRFIAFTPEQFAFLNKLELEAMIEMNQSKLLPNEHKSTQRVAKVTKQILDKNKDLEEIKKIKEWSVSVIDDENTLNACVLPSGNIFVCSGLLKICENDDQLGVILSHEISHALLFHGIEKMSHAHIVDIFFIGIIGFIWMLFPTDFLAALGTSISKIITEMVSNNPYSRMLETEADEVGLTLAAKSCFDVREAAAFWYKMSIIQKEITNLPETPVIGFLNTHPPNEKRCAHLESLLDKAMALRSTCGCASLPKANPMDREKKMQKQTVKDIQEKKYAGVLKIGDL